MGVDLKKELLAALEQNMHLDKFMHQMLDKALEPALKKLVQDTSSPFDDILFNAVYPALEAELKSQITSLWSSLFVASIETPKDEILGEPV